MTKASKELCATITPSDSRAANKPVASIGAKSFPATNGDSEVLPSSMVELRMGQETNPVVGAQGGLAIDGLDHGFRCAGETDTSQPL